MWTFAARYAASSSGRSMILASRLRTTQPLPAILLSHAVSSAPKDSARVPNTSGGVWHR